MAFVALLDANILFSAAVRDTMLRAAEKGLYRPAFTDEILNEMMGALIRQRPDLNAVRVERLAGVIRRAFPEALVTGYENLMPSMTNGEGDRHVLAAAVRIGAAVIVTENVRDFPAESRAPFEIDVQTADEFLLHLWSLSPESMLTALQEQADDLRQPARDLDYVVETLSLTAPNFSKAVSEHRLSRATST
ncbi:MAG: PIN domain-containing protein [Chloroflexota bacterium]